MNLQYWKIKLHGAPYRCGGGGDGGDGGDGDVGGGRDGGWRSTVITRLMLTRLMRRLRLQETQGKRHLSVVVI
jgi:hypothetical protein